MRPFDPQAYGPVFAPLLAGDRLCELGPGRPDAAARPALAALTVESAFAGRRVADPQMAACCLAAVWLLHDELDRSHTLSQDIPSASGSYWHGIMHRREPDYGNAKYWFRRVGRHPIFPALAEAARELAAAAPPDAAARFLADGGEWDPFRFVDLCEAAARGRTTAERLARQVAQAEWRLLFDHCYRAA